MAQKSKYADISDIDDAPEYYQTPDSPQQIEKESVSSNSSDYDEEDDQAVIRESTEPGQARKQFQFTKVDARGVDFSDRLHRKRRSYKTSRKQIGRKDATRLGDFSDEEDETFARKLARLQREVQEVEEEFEQRRKEKEERADSDDEDEESDEEDEEDVLKKINRVSESLDKVFLQRRHGATGPEAQLAKTLRQFSRASGELQAATSGTFDAAESKEEFLHAPLTPSAAQAQQRHALAKAADFDARLSALEAALGLNASNMPELAKESQKPILHILDALDTQISALASPGSTILDSANRKLHQLTQDAERLEALRKVSQPSSNRPSKPGTPTLNGETDSLVDPASLAKMNELYRALPTIESLSPTLPMVVERLRTLRLIHTSAGSAHSTLDEIEKSQMEQAAEIKKWRETLLQVEKGLTAGDETLKKNIGTMGNKVRTLEERLGKLGS